MLVKTIRNFVQLAKLTAPVKYSIYGSLYRDCLGSSGFYSRPVNALSCMSHHDKLGESVVFFSRPLAGALKLTNDQSNIVSDVSKTWIETL